MRDLDWSRIERLLDRCLELPPEARARFLADADDQEAATRARAVLSLESEADARGFLEVPTLEPAPPPEARRIGPWQVTERIGEGGMGVVFEAQRADGVFDKRVAIKLLKLGLCSEEYEERFRTEVRVLAALTHPGIAALHDAGRTESGQPYLVLELVRGDPIDVACDARGLGLRERVELALQVCDAIQFAHERGVLHRDLKPQNILVAEDGRVRLLDFGIAKVEGELEGLDTLQTTLTGQRLYSPRYASPEQIRGQRTAATSDVYSLGVVLYELLVGAAPYATSSTSQFELERAVCDTDAELASRSSGRDAARWTRRGFDDRAHLERALAGDLEWILAAALRKDSDRRYATMSELAEDLRRYLASLPVRARPESLAYRTRRFASRNRTLVTTASVLGVFLLLSTIFAWLAFLDARAEKQHADQVAYRAALQAAASALELGDVATAEGLLTAQPPSLRGWEWRHLAGRLDGSLRRFEGGTMRTTGLAASPDGARFFTAGSLPTTVDLATGVTRETIGHASCVAVSPGGELALGGERGSLRFSSATPESDVLTRELGESGIECIDYHPGGKGLVVGTYDGVVHRLDEPGAEPRWSLRAHARGDLVVRFSSDGERLATAAFDDLVQILDAETGEILRTLQGHSKWVTDVAWNRAGTMLVTVSIDGSVRTWDAIRGAAVAILRPLEGRLNAVRVLPGDEECLVAHESGLVLRMRLEDGSVTARYAGARSPVKALAVLPDGRRFLASNPEETLLFDLEHEAVPSRPVCEFPGGVRFSPSGERVAISGPDGRVRLYDADGTPRSVVEPSPRRSRSVSRPVAMTWRGAELVIGELDEGRLTLKDELGARILGPEPLESRWVMNEEVFLGLTWIEELGRFLTGSREPTLVSDAGTTRVRESDERLYLGCSCALRPRSSEVAFAFADREGATILERRDLETGAVLSEERFPGWAATCAAYSADGETLVVGGPAGVRLFELDTGEQRWIELGPVVSLAFHPHEPRLAVGSKEPDVLIVDLVHDEVLVRLRGHGGSIDALAFSPDGSTLVSAGAEGSARFWSAPERPDQSSIKR